MDYRRYGGLPNQPEAALCQILQEAQHRWLRPTEICEILRNYRKFKLTPDPPHKPQSGSLFLFDRKALRYFRKDGHNWRKKKDGKTVREAHERLKAGSVEVLHCYYAHGEDNENFQRRSYWMLDTNEHIVLVHYREVKEGSRSGLRSPNSYSIDGSSSFGNPRGVAGTSPQTSPLVSPRSSSPSTADWNGGVTNSPELDDHESSDDTDQYRLREIETLNNGTNKGGTVMGNTTFTGNAGHLSSSYFPVASDSGAGHGDKVLLSSYEAMNGTATSIKPSLPLAGGAQIKQEINSVAPPGGFDLYEYGEVLKKAKGWGTNGTSEISNSRLQNNLSQHRDMPMASDNPYTWFKSNAEITMNDVMGASQSSGNTRMAWQSGSQDFLDTIPTPATKYQCFPGDGVPSAQVPSTANTNAIPWSAVVTQLDGADNGLLNDSQRTNHAFAQDFSGNRDTLSTKDSLNRFNPSVTSIDTKDSSPLHSYSSVFRDFQADTPTQHEDMQILKFETFERWMGQEMGADGMLSSDSTWANVLAEDVPGLAQQMPVGMQTTASLLQEICFSITEFSPSCATLGFDTKVLVCGEFGVEVRDPSQVKWSCMFADIEVPAEVLQNGVLRCNVPSHPPGKVPFFVTRSDKIPCSEIKEFEFRAESKSSAETLEVDRFSKRHMLFQIRLARMLSNVSVPLRSLLSDQLDKDMISELTSLGLFGEWEDMEEQLTESGLGTNLREQYIQKLLKEKLQIWLLQKVLEGGKGAAVWDDNGLGVLHMGAALGYTWIIGPLLASGVNINFRDSRGWTALHWAAHCGREAMVIALLARGAAPGARTDPTNAFPGGQAPADLASAERHKGIAGYLAESSLTSHLSSLNLKSKSAQGLPIATDAVESASKMSIVQSSEGGPEVQLPLTLAAVRNATQAVARIQTEFRLESFRKKQESYQLEEDEYGISNEEAQYIVAAQKSGRGPSLYEDELSQVNAAIRIQQNYRGWKGRRNFLLFRQHVVKIQAHFRGHQVRKHYKKILWSVSIVEKAILRWRRKGRGLRGFGSIPLPENELGRNEEDDDFLKAGRKQIEASLEKALARVQSMVRSPEAQEQYRRLLEGYQKTKVHFEGNYDMLLTPGDKGHIFSEDYTMSTLR